MVDPTQIRDARKAMARVEKQLQRLHERSQRLHAEMVEAAHDHLALGGLTANLRDVEEQGAALEDEWLTLAEIVG